jgi:hypothetical protein
VYIDKFRAVCHLGGPQKIGGIMKLMLSLYVSNFILFGVLLWAALGWAALWKYVEETSGLGEEVKYTLFAGGDGVVGLIFGWIAAAIAIFVAGVLGALSWLYFLPGVVRKFREESRDAYESLCKELQQGED